MTYQRAREVVGRGLALLVALGLVAIMSTAPTAGAGAAGNEATVYLGLLERGGPVAARENQAMPRLPRARVVFEFARGEWRAIHEEAHDPTELRRSADWYPSPLRWTAVSDGQSLGRLTTRRPAEVSFYGAIGLQETTASSLPAAVGAGRGAEPPYPIWPGNTTYRPLVLVSGTSWKDPEGWKPFTLAAPLLDERLRRFRELLEAGVPITYGESGDTAVVAFQCEQGSLRLLRAHRSSDGRELLSVELTRCKSPVDDEIDEAISYAFLFDAGKLTPLGSDLALIDGGDYDGTGAPTWSSVDLYTTTTAIFSSANASRSTASSAGAITRR